MEQEQTTLPAGMKGPEPTYSGSFSHGWMVMKTHFVDFLVVLLIGILMSLPIGVSSILFPPVYYGFGFYSLFNIAYGFIVMAPVNYGICMIYLKAVRGEAFRPQELFYAFQQIWNIVLASLLTGAIVGIGIILLIVPGIIFACRLAFVPFLVMDRRMEAVEAVRKSWEMTRGYGWTIFSMAIMSFFIIIAGIICLVVGVIPASMWIQAAFTSLYHAVASKQNNPEAG